MKTIQLFGFSLGCIISLLGYINTRWILFEKALFICPDDVAATVHLSRLYLDPNLNACLRSSSRLTTTTTTTATTSSSEDEPTTTNSSNPSSPLLYNSDVDLAAGMLSYLTKGKGWNVPEA